MAASPRKVRTSPRKKAWASPPKASAQKNEADFSPLNGSWAEITANDESLNGSTLESLATSESRRSRKAALPKKASSKPKFVRSLELSEEVFSNSRRSERIKDKVDDVVIERKPRAEETSRPKELEIANISLCLLEGGSDSVLLQSRKRHLSIASTVTLNEEYEGCSPVKRAPQSSGRPSRKSLKSDSGRSPFRSRCLFPKSDSKGSTPTGEFAPKDFWEDPTLGWCKDQATLDRRTKEIERAKEKSVYARYLREVPRHLRIKGVHPRTPNKHINFSRRSWDVQIRTWKRSLYDWAGEEPSDSVNTSFCSYSSEELRQVRLAVYFLLHSRYDDIDQENRSVSVLRSITELEEIKVRPETDAMASLLGHFDMDSRRGDESTLKAPTNGQRSDGPVDFSTLRV
ncbi:unnamed protein product [Heligmosomoides polygyrus]|uniref:SLBP_RNA_bind domain-containing protein n=1 Tax=Heligmosomoides polygyrus TaxID=6339 RepID=A0A183F7H9_HELPZ|nr:unnamed protein product [Heligmosomoides polygyrus]